MRRDIALPPLRYRRFAMTTPKVSESPDVALSESRAATLTLWVLAVVMHAMTAGLIVILGSIVLFEEGDFGPAPRGDTSTILLCIGAMLGLNLLFPWALSFDNRFRSWEWRSPVGLHTMVAMCGMASMLSYLIVMDPAGGRREALTVALPAVLMPIGYLLSWRSFQIGAKSVGRPARDVSDWTPLDHLLGRRRRS